MSEDEETGINVELLKEIKVLEKMNICYEIINELKPNWGLDWEDFEKEIRDRRDEIISLSLSQGGKEEISYEFLIIFIKYVYNSIHSLLNTNDVSQLTAASRTDKFQSLKRYLMEN